MLMQMNTDWYELNLISLNALVVQRVIMFLQIRYSNLIWRNLVLILI